MINHVPAATNVMIHILNLVLQKNVTNVTMISMFGVIHVQNVTILMKNCAMDVKHVIQSRINGVSNVRSVIIFHMVKQNVSRVLNVTNLIAIAIIHTVIYAILVQLVMAKNIVTNVINVRQNMVYIVIIAINIMQRRYDIVRNANFVFQNTQNIVKIVKNA